MNRIKIVSRKQFSKEEKEFIRLTTNGRCAHCGKKLKLEDCTVEHIIPLNKGGTNDYVNLVVLCNNCNKEKDDLIADPLMYYPYISDLYTDSVQEMFEKYIENVSYIDRHNILYVDLVNCVYPASKESQSDIIQAYSKDDKLYMKEKIRRGYIRNRSIYGKNSTVFALAKYASQKSISVRRAKYMDLDDIWKVMWGKNGYTKESAKEKLSSVFSKYSVYAIRKGSDTIGYFFVVPMRLIEGKDIYIICLEDICCKYPKYYADTCRAVMGFASLFLEKLNLEASCITLMSKNCSLIRSMFRWMSNNYSLRDTVVCDIVDSSRLENGYYCTSATLNCSSEMYYIYNPDTQCQEWIRSLFTVGEQEELASIYHNLSDASAFRISNTKSSNHFLNLA